MFRLEDVGTPSPAEHAFKGTHYLVFLGPAPVDELVQCIVAASSAWLTLGLYNIVLDCSSARSVKSVLRFAATSRATIGHEVWRIRDGLVQERQFSPARSMAATWRKEIARLSKRKLPGEIADAVREYCPLMASTIARSEQLLPNLLPKLHDIRKEARTSLGDFRKQPSEESKYQVLGELLYLNAGLSRFSSQTFAGATSIIDTECHFWSHSLLGVGMGSLALLAVCRFIEMTLGEERLPDRFAELRKVKSGIRNLSRLKPNDAYWSADHLGRTKLPVKKREPLVPLLAYFSARDGFKSTLTTISAPLACVSSCNTLQWSLLTLTHEISHIIIRGVLVDLYPDLDSDRDVNAAMDLLEKDGPAVNLLDEIRRFLLFAIIKMDDVEAGRDAPPEYDVDRFRALLERWHHVVEETFAHLFDFMYFYGHDVKRYVSGIWSSWGVIPNINCRIRDYVLRTVCAVLSVNISRGPAGLEIARELVERHLKELSSQIGPSAYVDKAVEYIRAHWDDEIKPRLHARLPIIKIARGFLFSKDIATRVRGETKISGGAGEREGYVLREGWFEGHTIRNPVRFLELYTRSADPSEMLSAWLIFVLAFAVEIDGR